MDKILEGILKALTNFLPKKFPVFRNNSCIRATKKGNNEILSPKTLPPIPMQRLSKERAVKSAERNVKPAERAVKPVERTA